MDLSSSSLSSSMVVLLPPVSAFALPDPLSEAALAPRVAVKNAALVARAANLAGSAPSLLLLLSLLLMAAPHVHRSCLAAHSGRVATAAWTTACSSLAPSSTALQHARLAKNNCGSLFVRSKIPNSARSDDPRQAANLHVLPAQLTLSYIHRRNYLSGRDITN